MLSGIGPEDHLKSLNIPVIKSLPVGDNLQDHIALGGMVFTIDKVILIFYVKKIAD
jgi:choline dehydrogenase-like flavoprotein